MPDINFPNNPTEGAEYTFGSKKWTYNAQGAWERSAATETGNTEGNTGEVAYYDAKGSIIKGATAFYYDSTNLKVGVSGDFYVSAGATFGGDVNIQGNLLIPDDGFIGVGAGDERIIFDSNGNDIILSTNEVYFNDKLTHNGDDDTFISFTTDNIEFQAGGADGSIHMVAGISADAGATFANDIQVNDLTIGHGGGDVSSNTVVGYQALYSNTEGIYNVATGYQALYSNTGGDYNVASGYQALYSNTEGGKNIASGYHALKNNIDGYNNVASGHLALYSNTEGSNNVATGHRALFYNTEGDFNVASGYNALYSNTEGGKNIASGYDALYSNTEGDYNVASGYLALYANTEGDNNIAVGYMALLANTIGDRNSAYGHLAGSNGTTGSNNTYLGHNAQPSSATVNNEIVLGDSNVTLIHSAAGMSMGGGATFGGDINCLGNIVLTEDAEVNIGGDTEQIIFNGGSGQIRLAANAIMLDRYITHHGDSDTRIEFQTNQITLEVGGTDYIDITSAGTNFADTDVVRPNLKDYSETALATSTKNTSFNVDFTSGNVQSFTFVDDLTVSFTNPPASGTAGTITLIITNGGGNTTTWNAAVKWPGNNAPALTSSGVDIVSFMTIDAGTTIYGFVGGINFS